MNKLKSFTVTIIMILIIGSIFALFRTLVLNNTLPISIIDGLFLSAGIYTIIYTFQWIRERGFFNMIIYSHKRFSQSIKIAGGGISNFLSYITPDAIKSNKDKENTASNEQRIKPEDFNSYHKTIAWDNTIYKLLASIFCLLITFIISLLFI